MSGHLVHEFIHELGHLLIGYTLERKQTKQGSDFSRGPRHQRCTDLLSQAEVQRIIKELFIVGPQIKTNWKRRRRMNPGTSNIQGQFADGDWHSVDTEIT